MMANGCPQCGSVEIPGFLSRWVCGSSEERQMAPWPDTWVKYSFYQSDACKRRETDQKRTGGTPQ